MDEELGRSWSFPVLPVVIGVVSFGGGLALGYIIGKSRKAVDDYFVDTEEEAAAHEIVDAVEELVEEVVEETLEVFLTPEEQKQVDAGLAVHKYKGDSIVVDPMDPEKGRNDPAGLRHATPHEVKAAGLDLEAFGMEEPVDEPGYAYLNDGKRIPIEDVLMHQFELVWDWDEQAQYRLDNPDIYVIHMDEFFSNESEYTQAELNWYGLDDVLVDEEKTPIYDYEDTIGPFRWGYGSDDENIFYVRNRKIKVDFCILRNEDDSYMRAVLGIEEEDPDEVPRRMKKMKKPKEE